MQILNLNDKQKCQYAIPIWLRDEQIKLSVARIKGRIEPGQPRTERVAVVGFGPSLQDTWEQVRSCKWVITCSGSHKFLIERGIVPNWHVEVDPRAHKTELLGSPHKDVEYLAASTCHPKYFDHLEGFNVKLWHVFDNSEDGHRLLPHGEWQITGGCDVGLRALTIAAFLGFRELHVFGLDGSARGDTRHAAAHPHGKQPFSQVEFNGRTYLTTPAMMEAARQTVHELRQMPTVRATFYGDGLTQALVKDYKPELKEPLKPLVNIIGFSKPELISAEYRDLNARLHKDNLAYGVGGGRYADTVIKLATTLQKQTEFVSVLDFGCGKGYLAKALPFPIAEYDPAVPGKEESPRPADLVCCFDVLEHVEPDKIMFVLNELKRCVRRVGYFTIHMGPASKCYANGENAHLLQRGQSWWRKKLKKFFQLGAIIERPPMLHVVVAPK